MACEILVPQPGIEPMPATEEAQCLNHCPTWEVPKTPVLSNHFPCSPFPYIFISPSFLKGDGNEHFCGNGVLLCLYSLSL